MRTAMNPIYEMMGVTGPETKKLDDEGIKMPNDWIGIPLEAAVEAIKKAKINIMKREKLKAFIWWAKQPPENKPLTLFTQEVMAIEMAAMVEKSDQRSNKRKGITFEDEEVRPSKVRRTAHAPGPFNGNEQEFKKFKDGFEAYIGALGLKYIIRHKKKRKTSNPIADGIPDKIGDEASIGLRSAGGASLPTEAYLPDLDSPQYKSDNQFVFNALMGLLAGGTALSIIQRHKEEEDGRNAWIELIDYYEGESITDTICHRARTKLQSTRFTPNFRGGLTSYITIHMQQNTILDENDNPKPNKEKKFAFIAGLDDPSLDSAKQVVISRHDMSYQDTMTYIHQSYLTN